MSILSDLYHKRITWDQARAKAEEWARALVTKDPAVTQLVGALTQDVKQGFSDALGMADGALAPIAAQAAMEVEATLDAALLSATKGAALPFVPLVNHSVEQIRDGVVAAAHAWFLKTQAQMASPNPAAVTVTPPAHTAS